MNDVPTKLPDQSPPPSMLAGVEEHQVLAGSGVRKVAVRRVEVSQLICRLMQRHGAHLPFDSIDRLTAPASCIRAERKNGMGK